MLPDKSRNPSSKVTVASVRGFNREIERTCNVGLVMMTEGLRMLIVTRFPSLGGSKENGSSEHRNVAPTKNGLDAPCSVCRLLSFMGRSLISALLPLRAAGTTITAQL